MPPLFSRCLLRFSSRLFIFSPPLASRLFSPLPFNIFRCLPPLLIFHVDRLRHCFCHALALRRHYYRLCRHYFRYGYAIATMPAPFRTPPSPMRAASARLIDI